MATAERETKLYECQVKRRRVKTGGGYEPFWKTKSIAEALVDASVARSLRRTLASCLRQHKLDDFL